MTTPRLVLLCAAVTVGCANGVPPAHEAADAAPDAASDAVPETAVDAALDASVDAGLDAGPPGPDVGGLALWLDADHPSSIGLASTTVASWADRRGAGFPTLLQTTAAARPTYVSRGLGGRPVIRFADGDALSVSAFAGMGGADYTVLVVYDPAAVRNDVLLRTEHAEHGTTFRLERAVTGTVYQATHDAPASGTGDVVLASFPSIGTPKLLVVRRWTSGLLDHLRLTGNDADGDLDGISALQPTLVEPAIDALHALHLGDGETQGDLAEVLVYDRAIEDAELAELRAYLAAKWGL